jgi:hypothetical protein
VLLQPGESKDLSLDRMGGAKFVGVAGGYSSLTAPGGAAFLAVPYVMHRKLIVSNTYELVEMRAWLLLKSQSLVFFLKDQESYDRKTSDYKPPEKPEPPPYCPVCPAAPQAPPQGNAQAAPGQSPPAAQGQGQSPTATPGKAAPAAQGQAPAAQPKEGGSGAPGVLLPSKGPVPVARTTSSQSSPGGGRKD